MKKLNRILLFLALVFSASLCSAQTDAGELEKGIEFYEQGEYQKAADALQATVETDKKNRKAWLYLGMSQAKLKNSSQAVKAFQKADKLSDEEPAAEKPKITRKPRATYTDAARRSMTQGTIKLAVEFGADGKIKSVLAFQVLPDGLTENCIDAAKRIQFEPATKDGKAVSAVGIVTYTFTIY